MKVVFAITALAKQFCGQEIEEVYVIVHMFCWFMLAK